MISLSWSATLKKRVF